MTLAADTPLVLQALVDRSMGVGASVDHIRRWLGYRTWPTIRVNAALGELRLTGCAERYMARPWDAALDRYADRLEPRWRATRWGLTLCRGWQADQRRNLSRRRRGGGVSGLRTPLLRSRSGWGRLGEGRDVLGSQHWKEAASLAVAAMEIIKAERDAARTEIREAYGEATNSEARRVVAETALREERHHAEALRERLAEAEKAVAAIDEVVESHLSAGEVAYRGVAGKVNWVIANMSHEIEAAWNSASAAESRAKAAEERVAALEKALDSVINYCECPDGDEGNHEGDCWLDAPPCRAARRALGRAE